MNPLKLMQLHRFKQAFEKNHPRFFPFLHAASKEALQEHTVIDIQVTVPSAKTYKTNLKLTADDIEMLKELKKEAQPPHTGR